MKKLPCSLKGQIEIPIDPRHAQERCLPKDVCYMLVHDPRRPETFDPRKAETFDRALALAFGHWLLECVRPGEALYGVPLAPHISDKKLQRLVDVHLREVSTFEMGREVVVVCRNPETVASVLLDFHSERTAFMFAHDSRLVKETINFLDEYPVGYSSFEEVFVERLAVHSGFVFAADTHASLEVFGTKEFVVERCLPTLSAWVGIPEGEQ